MNKYNVIVAVCFNDGHWAEEHLDNLEVDDDYGDTAELSVLRAAEKKVEYGGGRPIDAVALMDYEEIEDAE